MIPDDDISTDPELEQDPDQGLEEDETRHRIYPSSPEVPLTDPTTGRQVGAEGLLVDKTDRFWLRRLRDGDAMRKPSEAKEHGVESALRDRSEREKGV